MRPLAHYSPSGVAPRHQGESHDMPKLTDDTWQAIRGQWATGASDASLATLYGVSRQTIKRRAAAQQWQRDDAARAHANDPLKGVGRMAPTGHRASRSSTGRNWRASTRRNGPRSMPFRPTCWPLCRASAPGFRRVSPARYRAVKTASRPRARQTAHRASIPA